MRPNYQLQKSTRRGISILEVLMSIFVISIGLLGIAALLPLAQHLAARGTTADRAAISGKEALRQFAVRGMSDPNNWLQADGTTAYSIDPTNANSPLHPLGNKAFCIDPRLVSRDATATKFPADNPAAANPTMPRITLRRWAGGASLGAAMPTKLADELFMLQDDLNFQIDETDASSPPVQFSPNNEKRFTDGDFSWLATLVREGNGQSYTLTVVVIAKRQTPTQTQEVSIPSANVAITNGIGGGDLQITNNAAAQNKSLTPGNWVMLSAGNIFRWYRIIYASDFQASNNSRYLTVAGRDWDAGTNPSAQLTIIPGAVAAYERTIRLDSSSLWQR